MNDAAVSLHQAPSKIKATPGEPRVFLEVAAERLIEEHTHSEMNREVCGILLGAAGQDESGCFTHVTRAIEGKFADQRGTSVTFTHETWDYVYKMIADEGNTEAIVGWYHSHPGFGVFYSSHDTFIQRHFFGQPWQVGIVVDPSTSQRGVFANVNDGIQGIERYWRLPETGQGDAEPVTCEYQERVAASDDADDVTPVDPVENELGAQVGALESRVFELERQLRSWRVVALAALLLTIVGGFATWNTYRSLSDSSMTRPLTPIDAAPGGGVPLPSRRDEPRVRESTTTDEHPGLRAEDD